MSTPDVGGFIAPVSIPSLVALPLLRVERPCPLKLGTPLDLAAIPTLRRAPLWEHILPEAIALDGLGKLDVLLDAASSDIWLPMPLFGANAKQLELLEPVGGCDEVQVVRLRGRVTAADMRLLSYPAPLQLPRQRLVGWAGPSWGGSWRAVLGLGRPDAARAGPFVPRLFEATTGVGEIAALVPGTNTAALVVARAGVLDSSVCESQLTWVDAVGSASDGAWQVALTVAVGSRSWNLRPVLDSSSSFLRLPREHLPAFLVALLADTDRCYTSAFGAAAAPSSLPDGPLICPCDVAQRPPLRLALGAMALPVPWDLLLQPMPGEPGLCVLRVHAAAEGSPSSLGTLLFGSHLLAFDYAKQRVGACLASPAEQFLHAAPARGRGAPAPRGRREQRRTPTRTDRPLATLVIILTVCPALGLACWRLQHTDASRRPYLACWSDPDQEGPLE